MEVERETQPQNDLESAICEKKNKEDGCEKI